MKFFRKSLILITLFWQIPAVLALLAYYISPTYHWLPIFFGLAFPFILLVNMLLLLFWAWRRKKIALVPAAVILLGWPQLTATLSFHFLDDKANNPERKVRVMSYNAKSFSGLTAKNRQKNLLASFDFINKIDPDILCLQEVHDYRTHLIRAINRHLKLKHSFSTKWGTTIYSKFPIKAKKVENFQKTGNAAIYVDLDFNGKTIRVFDVHFKSHHFETEDYELINNPNLEEKQQIKSTLRKVAKTSIAHTKQVNILLEHIKESPYPVILCGDFNEPPVSYTYSKIARELNDSFRKKGLGLGATFASIPGLRIDYIMANDDFEILSHRVKRYQFSDHYPVIAELELLD